MNSEPATKVAIIGGGCASIATAFELSRPEHRGRFDITVYQMGWRLGGKGASGRGPSGRIEEHGLHVWLGFYENAFRLLRECYAELAADPAGFDVGDWRDAFVTDNATGLSALSQDGTWHNWSVCFPARDGLPGDPISGTELFSVRSYVSGALDMLGALLQTVDSRRTEGGEPGFLGRDPPISAASVAGDPQRILSVISDLIGGAFAATTAVMVEALAVLEAGLQMLPSPLANPLTNLAEWIAHSLRQQLEKRLITEPYFQHVWEMMDVVVASVVGILRFGLLTDPRGFDAIDDYDWREWLRLNGASTHSIQSPFIRGLYDLVLAYDDGDPKRPRLSAASAVRGSFRLFFTYRGAFQWKLRAGMGDVVFAPFYEVLRRRGVKFAFFHRLTNVRLCSDADLQPGETPFVAGLDFDVQANVKAGADYAPLVSVKGRPCWPSGPDFSQLANGRRMASQGREFESHWDNRRVATRTLEVAKDFDFVVLGLSVGAIPQTCAEILARDPRWRRMVEKIKTVETQAFQIWLDEDLEEIGWKGPNVLGAAFIEPFDTWCDLAHTIPEEAWAKPPKTVLYFCGVLPETASSAGPEDPGYPEQRRADVRRNALTHLRETGRFLWPGAYDAGGEFRWDILRQAEAPCGEGAETSLGVSRFDSQYWRANVNPSDRYVLSVPGSAKYRISPLDMTYDNLTIAGDWTACGIDGGCVEAAVMSGRLAAHALAGAPGLEDIVGFDHP